MIPRRWQKRAGSLAHRLCSSLVLLAYLVTSTGLPMPTLPAKDRSQPFPCQNHVCGCQNAHDCWQQCCCFNREEKLAWAYAQQVEPPVVVTEQAGPGWQTQRLRDQAKGRNQPGATCSHCSPDRQSCPPSDDNHFNSRGSRPRSVLVMTALRCRGLSTSWVSSGAVAPPPPLPNWELYFALSDRFMSADDSSALLPQMPPDPPPRCPRA